MLVDTSAWVEYLRGTGSATAVAVRRLLTDGTELVTCDAVVMEILAGGRSDAHTRDLRALLARARRVPTAPVDWESAAQLYRSGRRSGVTVRKLVDCLIAAVAIRADQPLLHADADYDQLARISTLDARRA